MKTLRIGVVTQWYSPEPILQPTWIVQALAERTQEVRVVTAFPNYPTGVVHSGYRPWRPAREHIDGVEVCRAPVYPSHDQSAPRRMANYLSWAVSASLLVSRWLREVDVTLVYSSPATAALPAMVLRQVRRTPYVLLVQDVWPDSVSSSGFMSGRIGRAATGLLNFFVNRSYRNASSIAVISPGMRNLLIERGVPEEKIRVVHNWVRETPPEPSVPTLREQVGLRRTDLLVLYAGNHGAAQDLATVVSAFANGIESDKPCHLVLVGDGVEKPALRQVAAGSTTVHFIEPVPPAVIASWAQEADAQLVALADHPLFRITTPSKLQSTLAAGRPALAVAAGDVAQVVKEAGCGLVATPGNTESVVRAVCALAEMTAGEQRAMGQRGRHYYMTRMSEEVGASELIHMLRVAAN